MAIPVACACGKRFAANDNLAGKTVRCPQCQGALQIPAQVAETKEADALDNVDSYTQTANEERFCPSCKAFRKPGAIVCLQCGYNWRSRRKMQTRRDAPEEPPPVPTIAPETALESEGAPAWVYALGLGGVGATMVAANYAPGEALVPLGVILLVVGSVLHLVLAIAENPANIALALFGGVLFTQRRLAPIFIMMCGMMLTGIGAVRAQKQAETRDKEPARQPAKTSSWLNPREPCVLERSTA
jgi:hypothetical protein